MSNQKHQTPQKYNYNNTLNFSLQAKKNKVWEIAYLQQIQYAEYSCQPGIKMVGYSPGITNKKF